MSLDFLFSTWCGITYGTIYAIVAIGFNIIYNTTRHAYQPFAQGEFVMAGRDDRRDPARVLARCIGHRRRGRRHQCWGGFDWRYVLFRWLRRPSVLR